MEQFRKIVLEVPEGMHYTMNEGENGELIVWLVPNHSPENKDDYFTKITVEDRERVKKWIEEISPKTEREHKFLERVKEAIRKIDYDYWIANLEPSVADGKIYYAEGHEVGVRFSCNQWTNMANNYDPERGSRLAKDCELLIWYALRIVNGLWTIHYATTNSAAAGNYRDAPGHIHCMEKTGERECGGFCDGQGNSYKIVTCEGGYALVGGCYMNDGYGNPVASTYCYHASDYIQIYGSGVLVLTK